MSTDHEREVEALSSEISLHGKLSRYIVPELVKGIPVYETEDREQLSPQDLFNISQQWFMNRDKSISVVKVQASLMDEALLAIGANHSTDDIGGGEFMFFQTHFKEGEGVAVVHILNKLVTVKLDGEEGEKPTFLTKDKTTMTPILKMVDMSTSPEEWLVTVDVIASNLRTIAPKKQRTATEISEEEVNRISSLI